MFDVIADALFRCASAVHKDIEHSRNVAVVAGVAAFDVIHSKCFYDGNGREWKKPQERQQFDSLEFAMPL